jgi:hypothetical protein
MSSRSIYRHIIVFVLALTAVVTAGCQSTGASKQGDTSQAPSRGAAY